MRYLLAALSTATLLPALTGCGGGSSSTHTTATISTSGAANTGTSSTTATSATPTQTTNADGSVTSTPRSYGGLQFTLTTNKATYAEGEDVQCTFTITNTSTQVISDSGIDNGSDLTVYQGNNVVYPGAAGGIGQNSTLVWAPGETKTLTIVWRQRTPQGMAVSPGTYTIVSYLNPSMFNGAPISYKQDEALLVSNPVTITITP